MNPDDGLAEKSHDQRVHGVCAGQFHVRSEAVGRDALEHQLSGVGVLAFIALERGRRKADANQRRAKQNENERELRRHVASY